MYSTQLVKGTYPTIILKLLKENGRMYGYEISQMVKEKTDGNVLLPEGSLYPILHKMTEEGVVRVEEERIGKRLRRYYSLSSRGTSVVDAKIDEFQRFMDTMGSLLNLKPA